MTLNKHEPELDKHGQSFFQSLWENISLHFLWVISSLFPPGVKQQSLLTYST